MGGWTLFYRTLPVEADGPKNVVLLLSNVENNKYTETETGYRKRVKEWSYYILCENF